MYTKCCTACRIMMFDSHSEERREVSLPQRASCLHPPLYAWTLWKLLTCWHERSQVKTTNMQRARSAGGRDDCSSSHLSSSQILTAPCDSPVITPETLSADASWWSVMLWLGSVEKQLSWFTWWDRFWLPLLGLLSIPAACLLLSLSFYSAFSRAAVTVLWHKGSCWLSLCSVLMPRCSETSDVVQTCSRIPDVLPLRCTNTSSEPDHWAKTWTVSQQWSVPY